MSARRTFALVPLAAAIALACNAISGIGDVVAEDPSDTGDEAAVTPGTDADTNDGGVAPPPTCVCVAPTPPDWTGPIALLEAIGDKGRACPTGLTAQVTGGADLLPGSDCMPCTCATPTGTCDKVMVQVFTGTQCVATCNAERAITTNCTTQSYCSTTSSGNAYLVKDGGASCAASASSVRPRPWTHSATSCGFTQPFNDCPAGLACAPRSVAAPDARSCIQRTGDHACPDGPYSLRHVFHAKVTDNRACSACTCGTANIVNCTAATVTFYNGNNCNMPSDSWSTTGACDTSVVFDDLAGSAKITTPSIITGNCPASGGTASGTIAPQDPTTFCCLP